MGQSRTDVQIAVDAQDLGRLQNAVAGTNGAVSAFSRLLQGDLVGAAQQGAASVRQLWKVLASSPGTAGIALAAAAATAAIKLWENAQVRALEKTERMISKWKEWQNVFRQNMGYDQSPIDKLEKDIDRLLKNGDQRQLGFMLANAMSAKAEAEANAAAAREAIKNPVMKPGGTYYGNMWSNKGQRLPDVIDEEATNAMMEKAKAAEQALLDATKALDLLREANIKADDAAQKAAADKAREAQQAADAEKAAMDSAVEARKSAWARLEEVNMGPAELAARRRAQAKETMASAVQLPAGAAREEMVAKAYDLEREAETFKRQAAADSKQRLERKARDAAQRPELAGPVQRASFSEGEFFDQMTAAVSLRATLAGLSGQARGRRVMAGSVGGLVAGIASPMQSGDAARVAALLGKTPEQRSLDEIRAGVQETNRILERKLGLP